MPSTAAVDEAACQESVLQALQLEESMDFLLALEELTKPPSTKPLKRTKSLSHLVRRCVMCVDGFVCRWFCVWMDLCVDGFVRRWFWINLLSSHGQHTFAQAL